MQANTLSDEKRTLLDKIERDCATSSVLQITTEFVTWLELLKKMGVKSYLELGTFTGQAALTVKAYLGPNAKVITIDRINADEERDGVIFVKGDSDDHALRERIVALHGQPDAIFIDANHEYEAVKRDYECWWPVTNLVAGFHDLDLCVNDVARFFWFDLNRMCQFTIRHGEWRHWTMGLGIAVKMKLNDK